MNHLVKAVHLLSGHTINPADEGHHDVVIAAVLSPDHPNPVRAISNAYRKASMGGEKYWAHAITALLIAQSSKRNTLLFNLHSELNDYRAAGSLHRLYPMVLIGILEAAVWQRAAGVYADPVFAENVPTIFGEMFVHYTDGSGHGLKPCSDWTKGAFTEALSKYFGKRERNEVAAGKEITLELKNITNIGDDVQDLYSALMYQLFALLDLDQQSRALEHGFLQT